MRPVFALPALLLVASACDGRGPSGPEWAQVRSLAALETLVPPVDRSNKYAGDVVAATLGQRFYFDTDFSGSSTLVDMLGRTVPSPPARAATKGVHLGINCATCHDPARGGSDHSSLAQVSIGAGAYDVSSQPSTNSAFNELWYWNGRNDSLWSQIVAVTESPVSMGGNRLRTMWRIADAYRADYEATFGALPVAGTLAEQKARIDATTGQCVLAAGACPSDTCVGTSTSSCWPRFPIEGRPGRTMGCQRDSTTEPFHDAFDCMEAADRDAVTAVYVRFAKAIAAYETRLISQNAPFDRYVAAREAGETGADLLSESAIRGARLFAGDAACIECHSGPLLTDNLFHDIAVPQDGPFVPTVEQCVSGLAACDCTAGRSCLPWGLFDGLTKLQANGFRRDSKWSDDPSDASRAKFYTLDLTTDDAKALRGHWKTPGLRDVAITAPYMHTGRYRTLREVVEHYNGGGHPSSTTRDPKVVPLGLSAEDVDDLVAFLESLTGEPLPQALVTAPPTIPPASPF